MEEFEAIASTFLLPFILSLTFQFGEKVSRDGDQGSVATLLNLALSDIFLFLGLTLILFRVRLLKDIKDIKDIKDNKDIEIRYDAASS